MSSPKFSIIVPAYNSAQYITTALDSITTQTFLDYELIVVCDSCKDNTAEIAECYTDKIFEVDFHRDGLARNVGIDNAVGDWLLFMDDDDHWLHEYVLAQLADMTGYHNEDILRFSFIWKGIGYAKCGDYFACWNKVWKRSFVGDTRFSDIENWSDVDFHNAMMAKNPIVYDWNMPMYYYNFMRPGSISERNQG